MSCSHLHIGLCPQLNVLAINIIEALLDSIEACTLASQLINLNTHPHSHHALSICNQVCASWAGLLSTNLELGLPEVFVQCLVSLLHCSQLVLVCLSACLSQPRAVCCWQQCEMTAVWR